MSCADSATSAAFYHPESFNITSCGVAIPSVGALTVSFGENTVSAPTDGMATPQDVMLKDSG